MARHKVTKTVDFCYGHRLLEYDGKCKHLHGHNGLLEVDLEADSLDSLGMVMDFTQVRDVVKNWVDENLDHKMLLRRDDPVAPILKDLGEPVYLLDGNPTAENIAMHIYHQAHSQGLMVAEIRLWESPSSYATYREG
jgi:6-pyruvoyltetrahydropterin/6-carboxytetrahydropterin synthase